MGRYLTSGHPVLDVTELTTDAIGNRFRVPGGSSVLTDGTHAWRADLAHYVNHYSIALPAEFTQFMDKHGYRVPQVTRKKLIDISMDVTRFLGFRADAGSRRRGDT
ncbi:hypothetical protein H0H10_27935 [Streptomyces sp. TRM S81-3]|uniref:Uncharacterized protein n=1 Tax=Streptomyces griseicoloratus TaxID=2752516 RepID=A0A926L5E8_9ACTN|nr:hypothetical protein [Streptomyces griseicoloratus]MBD0422940.1 hypothetical protein [Streptomyces griseicoloratus]